MAGDQSEEKASFQTEKVTLLAAGHGVQDTYQAFLPALLPILIDKFSLIKTEAGLLSVFVNTPSLLQPFIATGENIGLAGSTSYPGSHRICDEPARHCAK